MRRYLILIGAALLFISVLYLFLSGEAEKCRIALYMTHDHHDSLAVAIANPSCRKYIVATEIPQ